MSYDRIAVDTTVLNKDTIDMETALNSIRAQMARMKESIDSLNAMWEGEAKGAFTVQFSRDYEHMEKLCAAASSIIENMHYAVREYSSCEQSVADVIAAIKIDM